MFAIITKLNEELNNYRSLAVIGLSKNAGKTTTLNAILKLRDYTNCMLTSIGYDGEEADLIFNTKKPTIYIKENTIIATAKKCLLNSEISFEILETTGFNTPLGEVIIARSLNEGLIELAGPSYNEQLKKVINILQSFNPEGLCIIDGALNRKGFADPSVCDATILCSGMSLSKDIDEVVAKTIFTLDIFKLDIVNEGIRDIIIDDTTHSIIIDKNHNIRVITMETLINHENEIIKMLDKRVEYLYINGPLVDKMVLALIGHRLKYPNLKIVVDNATKVFINQKTLEMLKKTNIKIMYLNNINIIGVSTNPVGINYDVDSDELVDKIKLGTKKMVFDMVKGVK
ncbi:MAG: hypothetical protein LBT75_05265 [Bacilli bacterium]|jgi:hypothetical protein|nr:hypothetical protein [Bacilli bacterium]